MECATPGAPWEKILILSDPNKLQVTNEAFNDTIHLSLALEKLSYHSNIYTDSCKMTVTCIVLDAPPYSATIDPLLLTTDGFKKQITTGTNDFASSVGEFWHLPELLLCANQPCDGPRLQILETKEFFLQVDRSPLERPGRVATAAVLGSARHTHTGRTSYI